MYKIDEIVEMLENINKIADDIDNVDCLRESIESYVYAMQEFFKGAKSLENVKQAFMREINNSHCIRCDNILNKQNYMYENDDKEFICNSCLEKEFL